jgi:hypothetical protein
MYFLIVLYATFFSSRKSMQNVKFYLLQNRILIPILLLSMLIIPPWTQPERFQLPSFLRPVALTKNFNHHHLIIDTDHQPSDYWWDDTNSLQRHSPTETLLSTATPSPLLDSTDPTSATLHKLHLFSQTRENLTLPLSPFFPPPLALKLALFHPSTSFLPPLLVQFRQNSMLHKTPRFSNSNVTVLTVFLKQQLHKNSLITPTFCFFLQWLNNVPPYDFRNSNPPP